MSHTLAKKLKWLYASFDYVNQWHGSIRRARQEEIVLMAYGYSISINLYDV